LVSLVIPVIDEIGLNEIILGQPDIARSENGSPGWIGLKEDVKPTVEFSKYDLVVASGRRRHDEFSLQQLVALAIVRHGGEVVSCPKAINWKWQSDH
jgi:hypothetical protein